MRTLIATVLGLTAAVVASPAGAGKIPCEPVEEGVIFIDGFMTDWKGARPVRIEQAGRLVRGAGEWEGPADLSFDVYCNDDGKSLYLAIDVRDEYFVRTSSYKGEDHIVLHLGGRQLIVYPGDLRKIRGKVTWGPRGKATGIEMSESRNPQGYSVELKLPYASLAGFRKGMASYPAAIWVADCDSKARGKVQTVIGTARSPRGGKLTFARPTANLDAFLRDRGASRRQVRTRIVADVVGGQGVEQVLLVGKTIGIVGDELPGGAYFYLNLPVASPKDVYWLKVMDLNGDGKGELITRYLQRSDNGRRELIAVYHYNESDQFVRWLAHEILKGQKDRLIVNRFRFQKRRGRGRKRGGVDLIFDKPQAKGFTAETFREAPASDILSILLPWDEVKQRHFRFEGEEYFQK